jgi:hypothetical protein
MNQTDVYITSRSTTSSEKSPIQQFTITLTPDEVQILEQYCEQTGKSEMDMIRELIQGLPIT